MVRGGTAPPDRPAILAPAAGPPPGRRRGVLPPQSTMLAAVAAVVATAAAQPADAANEAAPPSSCSQRYHQAFSLQPELTSIGASGRRALPNIALQHAWGLAENLAVVRGDERYPAAIAVRYPKGSYVPSAKGAPRGGAGFHAPVLGVGVEAACLRYAVKFPAGFAFAKGGKLPGLYGGAAPTGCRTDEADGFSLRYMWRGDGDGELYAYLPNREERCGESIARGAWRFPAGRWLILEQEVVLNRPGRADGAVQVWADGVRVLDRTDLALRQAGKTTVAGLMFSTFFGGNDPSWASPSDQTVLFADFRLYKRN